MKELSIEEKAKRYDEAIEKFDVILNLNTVKESGTIFADDVRKIFPELAESEDEKVRKEILNYIIKGSESCYDVQQYGKEKFEKWIAWLEKQREQKLNVNDNAKEMFIKALECVEEQNAKGYKLTDCDKNSWWEDFKAYTTSKQILANSAKTCKDEQKPAEEYNITGIGSKNAQGKLGQIIKKLKPVNEVLEQKPWSEEDERKSLEIKCLIGNYRTGNDEYELCSWIDKLKNRVQPKQEWSEGDKAVLDALIRRLEGDNVYVSPHLAVECLKSIRHQSQWKPSDEQLEALEHSLGDYNIKIFEDRYEILKSLYNNLKKLKG